MLIDHIIGVINIYNSVFPFSLYNLLSLECIEKTTVTHHVQKSSLNFMQNTQVFLAFMYTSLFTIHSFSLFS